MKNAPGTYNTDDLRAGEKIASNLIQIIRDSESRTDVELSDKPKRIASEKGVEIHGSLESLLRSAHFTYARSRIKVASERATQDLPSQRPKAKRSPRRRCFSTIKGRSEEHTSELQS